MVRNLKTQFLRSVAITAEKNIRTYYTKAPVMIFGFLFPTFMFLAFYVGRDLNFHFFFPGLLAISLFFTSSSVGPLITSWEKQAGTYERLLSFPVTTNTIILGDTIAGMLFGVIISMIILVGGLVFLNYTVNIPLLTISVLLSAFCFASLGVLLASPSVRSPSHIMMLSSLIRLPLIFISGIFTPLGKLQGAGKILCYFSPITYLVDAFNFSLKGTSDIFLPIDFAALFAFSVAFVFLSNRFHKRNLLTGI